jgi:hypothetical protein
MRQHNHSVHLRYRDHYLVDGGKGRIILGMLVTATDVIENMPFLDMIRRACFRWKLRPRSATGDTTAPETVIKFLAVICWRASCYSP